MKIAFVCFFEDGRISGPSNSMTSLAAKGLAYNHDCSVFTTSYKHKNTFILNGIKVNHVKQLIQSLKKFDLVVMSGLFDYQIFKVSIFCKLHNVSYIISPRSNLMKSALQKSQLKKKLALLTYSKFIIQNASSVHFLSNEEYKNSLQLNDNYFIARNGVSGLPLSECKIELKENLILFVGRLDISHKGLDLLLDSLSLIKDKLISHGWRVELRGPGSKKVVSELTKKINHLNLGLVVNISPAVTGDIKFNLMNRSKIFLHPSRYEGQPQSVIEAMSCGSIPVVTLGANMNDYVKGFINSTKFCPESFSLAILHAINMSLDISVHKTISDFAHKQFSWDLASKEFYDNLINK